MLRLSLLLGISIYLTLLLAGEHSGQLRPGLARAMAEGEEIVVLAPRASTDVPAMAVAEPVAAAPTPEPPAEVVTAAYVPAAPAPAPEPAVRKASPEPVFTLSTLPTIGGDVADPAPEIAAEAPAPEASADERQVWYVTASSVNVREGPSTGTSVVGRLTNGEAVTVVGMEGGSWAHILIEGDGMEGYIAARFLTPG